MNSNANGPRKLAKNILVTDHLATETNDYSGVPGGSEAYDFGPQILYFAILLILNTLFHRYWKVMTQANQQTSIDITVTGDLATDPPWLLLNTKRTWAVQFQAPHCWCQLVNLTIPQLTTSHHDGYWWRMFRIAVQNYMSISMTGDLAVYQPWLFWDTTKRTENRYFSGPHILDFQFLLLSY